MAGTVIPAKTFMMEKNADAASCAARGSGSKEASIMPRNAMRHKYKKDTVAKYKYGLGCELNPTPPKYS